MYNGEVKILFGIVILLNNDGVFLICVYMFLLVW